MRSRTIWDARLKLYPIVVIPLMVYFVAAGGPIPETEASNGNEASGGHSVAAPLSGFHQGRAIVCERRPMITFCFEPTSERR